MSKADVLVFFCPILEFLIKVAVYGWPVATLAMWVVFVVRYRGSNYSEDSIAKAFTWAILMTMILCVFGGTIWWLSLPDARPVVSVNAR